MKKTNIIEEITLDMKSTEKLMPSVEYVITDEEILRSIAAIDDIEQTDRYGRTLLINAAACERINVIQYLLSRNADINASDKNGFTALHMAVQTKNIDLIKFLIENGSDIHARNTYGNEPLGGINLSCPHSVIELLLEYGADPDSKNNYDVCLRDVYAAYPDIIALFDKYKGN